VGKKKENSITDRIPNYSVLEKICDSFPHVVYRAKRTLDDQEVVLKTLQDHYPKKEWLASIRREFNILTKVQGQNVIKAYEFIPYGNGNLAIAMEPFGISLSQYLESLENKTIPLVEFFEIAIKVVEALGVVHENQIIHKDLVPRNILIDPKTKDLRIIDFSASSELFREHQEVTFSKVIDGSLPYLSPEQSGRMNRDIDYRTDYYALGISFYQMLSGRLPFQANDALEWVYAHISKKADLLHEVNPKIPLALSNLVAKLMAKNTEDRYQSSFGLKSDLVRIWNDLKNGKDNPEFELAQFDASSQFQVPQKIYGRNAELQKLEEFFTKAADGAVEFCLVSGYSGLGKSVLVHELGRSIVKKHGYLIHGKFEQFKQNTAYRALSNAFRDLVRQLLGEPKERLDHWNERISEALGTNAQIIIDLIPELELIIGPQQVVQELSPEESQNRFLIQFSNFVKVFANELHPMVIFLDDLQWSDIPTLNFIQRLVTNQDLSNLLIIGAYRDNEVDQSHPFRLTLNEIEEKRKVDHLSLKPLSIDAVRQITEDTLMRLDQDTDALSKILFEKAEGNPFFTIELLKNLHEQGSIYFNSSLGKWEVELAQVQRVQQSDNVIDFLVAGQHRLTPETQNILQLAACIGAKFDLKTLAIIGESTMEKTAVKLYDALKANMILPLNENYKLVGVGEGGEDPTNSDRFESESIHLNPTYKFQHDRVQQAVYTMILPEKRKQVHLSIGKLILNHTREKGLEDVLMDVVSHLNEGRVLVKDQEELVEIADLNLQAGIKAKQSSAYASALSFLKISLEILQDIDWKKNYPLKWKLAEELQHCFYLTGDRENAEKWTEIMLSHSRSKIEKALVLSARTRQYATIGKMKESIVAAQEGLLALGFVFNEKPTQADVDQEVQAVVTNLKGRAVEDLIQAPPLTDPKARIASQLLMEIFAAAFLSGSGTLFPYLTLKSVNLALKYGNSPETAFAYGAYGMILCGFLDDPAKGYKYGKLSVDLIESFDDLALRSRIIYVYAMFVHHWSKHWSSMTPWFKMGIEAGYQSGDLLYLAYSAQDCIIWDPSLDLEYVTKEHRQLLTIVKECEYQDSYDSGTLFLQMQLNFQGLTESTFSMSNEDFNEEECVKGMHERRFMTGIANYHIYKSEIYLLYNHPKGAIGHILEQEKLMASVMSLPQLVRFHIISFLIRSMYFELEDEEGQTSSIRKMKASLDRMSFWAAHCPENFEHLKLLMEAELEGHFGQTNTSIQLYEAAIHAAKANSFVRDEAMANEMAGRYLLRINLEKAAEGYLKAAHYLYYRWGAHRKIEEMEKEYDIFQQSNPYSQGKTLRTKTSKTSVSSDTFSGDQLDMNSVFRASQSISGELVLDKLLKATLDILIENAGAQKGFLVQDSNGQLSILASNLDEDYFTQSASELTMESDRLPITIINTAIRTNEPIVIGNASEPNNFSTDPYILLTKPLSVMCVPIADHKNQKLAIYLENNLAHSAFTEGRVKVIKLLAAQAAISIENSRIYEEQDILLKAQKRFVPSQFLKHLGHNDIAKVALGESVSMEMSVLFSDIRDFTPLVELLTPQAVIELLNEYYSQQGTHITEAGGFIDSYSGDEILALFAVPAQQAVEAGVKMGQELWHFNQQSHALNRPQLKMGIGINTGPLVLGTMGGLDRMQCSVLGDTVNLASRIENLTKTYGSQFLIGENTFLALDEPEKFSIRMVDRVAVKGKDKAIRLYEVLDAENDERRAKKESTRTLLSEAFEFYYDRDFKNAKIAFLEGSKINPEDPVFRLLLDRATFYAENPPSKSWQGYEVLTFK